jgi:Asp-tRNA(Asn)/Glu-tRNA(Gln) amidotransferase A subunit family amidase
MSLVPPPTVEDAIARIRSRDKAVRAFVCTQLDDATRRVQEVRKAPPQTAIAGLPYSLKDLWDTAGIATTGCSHRYKDRVPTESAPIHRIFEAAGAVLLGKTNASDLGLAMESDSYVGGMTSNPHNLARTAGGSSGGAAAAVADRMSAFDWGSDFGGSIRLPAAFNGVFGLRLSSEAWPVHGHFPQAPTVLRYMNGQGPITARLDIMRDLLRLAAPTMRTGLSDSVRPFEMRGVYLYEPVGRSIGQWPTFTADVTAPLRAALGSDARTDHGLPPIRRAADIARAMYASHLMDFLESDTSLTFYGGLQAILSSIVFGGRFGDKRFHPRTAEMLLLIALGRATLFRDKTRAEKDAATFREDVRSILDRGYAMVMPVTTFPAPEHGKVARTWSIAAFNMPGNIADVTGLALPFGRFSDGMPRGLQIWGPPGSEEQLISLAEGLTRAS